MKYLIFVVLSIVFLSGCVNSVNEPKKVNECSSDVDCVPAGCSNQVCAPKEKASEIVTTCEYKQEYSCLQKTSCGCVDNKCEWDYSNAEYRSCMDSLQLQQEGVY